MPLVSRTFDQLIDFTRTSSATFVGSNGLIQSTPQSRNLLTFTQEFDNAAWSKLNVTATANSTTAPDGTSTADTFQATATTGAHNLQQSGGGSGAPLTLSVYAKAGTHSFLQLSQGSAVGIFANFNLSTGALGTVGASAAASITSVGSGWYRCSMTFTPASAANMRIGMVTSGTAVYTESWTAAGTETIFLWGAQLELGSTATDYTRNFGGLFPPRFDYGPVTLAPRGLLIEEQRTNLLTYSEQFDNAAWTKSNSTVTANATTSPDGTVDADKLVENTATSAHTLTSASVTATATTSYTVSIFAKAAERTKFAVWLRGASSGNRYEVGFDLSAGTAYGGAAIGNFTNGSASITPAGNGWYRCTVTATTGAGETLVLAPFALLDTAATPNNFSYTGDGTSGMFFWGAQLEAGAFATSYIPTVASQVTRTADTALIQAPNFAPWYNQSEGTIVVGVSPYQVSVQTGIYALNDNTANNRMDYRNVSSAFVTAGGVSQASMTTTALTPGGVNTVGFAYRTNDLAASANGVSVVTDTSATIPTVTQLRIGALDAGANQLNGHIRSIRYYPVRLSDAQLQALTA